MTTPFNVESFGINYAQECYEEYYRGNVNAADSMYEKGEAVANCDKYKALLPKWQVAASKDDTQYEMEDELNSNKAENPDDPSGTAGKILKFGEKVGLGLGSSSPDAVIKSAPSIMAACMLMPLGIIPFSLYGALFLTVTSAFKSMAKNDRKHQEEYFKQAETIMNGVDLDKLVADAMAINQQVTSYTQEAENFSKAAGVEVTAANTVSSATSVSEQNVSVSAQAIADEGAGQVANELEALDKGILSITPNLDEITETINHYKDLTTSIKENYDQFKENRELQKKTMERFAIAAGICIAGSGAVLAVGLITAVVMPHILGLFATAITAFTAALIVALTELSPQKKAAEALKENEENTNNWLKKAQSSAAIVNGVNNIAITNEKSIEASKEEAQSEDVNVSKAA